MTRSESSYRKGLLCAPHSSDSVPGVAAAVHLAAISPNIPYIEFPLEFPPTPLVRYLLEPPPRLDSDGLIPLPSRPGLGWNVNPDVVKRFQAESVR